MNRITQRVLILSLLALLGAAAVAQETGSPGGAETVAEIRIDLPPDTASLVSVEPGNRQIVVDLPRGSVFPLDLYASSNGLVRRGEVSPLDDDRVQLTLEIAAGLLHRIDYGPQSLVLVFQSRFQAARGSNPANDVYLMGPDDKLRITIHNHPELESHPAVGRDGNITAPLVGDVEAAGQSVQQLSSHLAELLGQSYLVDPQVDVEVEEFRSQWVMVTGEVQLPGRVPLRGGTRVKEILSVAGGFTDEAGETIIVSRMQETSEDYAALRLDRRKFEGGFVNPMLRHGDIVEVTRAEWCYLQGEVRSPGRVRIERGTTLLRAIAMSGGLTDWADKKSVRILYPDGVEAGEGVYNLKRIQNGRDKDPVLTGGEVVVVGRRFF